MKNMNKELIQEFLARLGSRYPKQATLYLLGGSALILLGSSRDTLNIDYVGNDMQKDDFQILIEEIAAELEQIIKNSLSRAGKFDFHPEILAHFEYLKKRLK